MPQRLCMEEIHSKSRQDLNLEKGGGEKKKRFFLKLLCFANSVGFDAFQKYWECQTGNGIFQFEQLSYILQLPQLLVLWSLLVDISTLAQNLK